MANNVFNQLNKRFNHEESVPNKGEAVMRALELLRINIQSAFDKEIDVIVKKFTELYFETAFKNIKENLGEHGISEDVLSRMTCALLENAKSQYNSKFRNCLAIKCPRQGIGEKRQYFDSTEMVPIKKEIEIKKEELSPDTTPHSEVSKLVSSKPRMIFWNTGSVTTETRFILDIQANQAFGIGYDGKDRLATKHPELIRYLPDGVDRDWLVEHKVIPSQHKNSRFLFLLYDEVIRLSQSERYCHRENLNLTSLHYFRLPKFMIDKMHIFFLDLYAKSKGMIITSNDKKRLEEEQQNQQQQELQQQQEIEVDQNSHLRNALLQGTSSNMMQNRKQECEISPQIQNEQQIQIIHTEPQIQMISNDNQQIQMIQGEPQQIQMIQNDGQEIQMIESETIEMIQTDDEESPQIQLSQNEQQFQLIQNEQSQIQVTQNDQLLQNSQQQFQVIATSSSTSTTIFQQSNGAIFQVKPRPSLSLSHATLTALLRSNTITNTTNLNSSD